MDRHAFSRCTTSLVDSGAGAGADDEAGAGAGADNSFSASARNDWAASARTAGSQCSHMPFLRSKKQSILSRVYIGYADMQ